MPEISRFFGIVVAMYYDDHSPPHFHVRYGEQTAAIEIETLRVLEGSLSNRVSGLVWEWARLHLHEIMEDWTLAREHRPLKRVAPLE